MRQVRPFQWAPAPPRPVPGRNEPRRRIGSAVSDGEWRSDTVSIPESWNSSWRTAYLRSSRTPGSAKSSRAVRLAPRSRPTTFRPTLVSSRARMLPVQPTPITTASTSLRTVAMVVPSLREVRDRARWLVVLLAEVCLDVLLVGGGQARIAHHLPRRLVAVAAVDRIGEEALHRDLQQRVEEHPAGERREIGLAAFHRLAGGLAILRAQPIEVLAIRLAAEIVGRDDAGAEELARRERELIAELGLCLDERPLAIEPRAIAERARSEE